MRVPIVIRKTVETNPMREDLRARIIEYACSAWAMGSAYDVLQSLGPGNDEDGYWFVKTYEKEIDWVAENMETLILGGIDGIQ